MNSPKDPPKTYLPLAKTSAKDQKTANFSTYFVGSPHGQCQCQCAGPRVARYKALRFEPTTSKVDPWDTTFAELDYDQACYEKWSTVCSGSVPPYGIASSCAGNYVQAGEANLDLTGTPFRLADINEVKWLAEKVDSNWGFTSAGHIVEEKSDLLTLKVVWLLGGGDAGGYGAYKGITLTREPPALK